jgi:hypothetical protein
MLSFLILFAIAVPLCWFLDRTDPPVRYPVLDGLAPRDQRRARRVMRANRKALRRSLRRIA